MKGIMLAFVVFFGHGIVAYSQSDSVVIATIMHSISSRDTIGYTYHVTTFDRQVKDSILEEYSIQYYRTPSTFYFKERNNILKNEAGHSVFIDNDGQAVYYQKVADQVHITPNVFPEMELLKQAQITRKWINNVEYIVLSVQNSEYHHLSVYFDVFTYLPVSMAIDYNAKYIYDEQSMKLTYPSMLINIDTFFELNDDKEKQIEISDVLIISEDTIQLTQQFSDYDLFKLSE